MRFEFATATQILFGEGAHNEIGRLAGELGKQVLVVYGLPEERIAKTVELVSENVEHYICHKVIGEPNVESANSLAQYARQQACDLVIGIGGGSALDMAKAVAAMLSNPGDLFDYLEILGKGLPLSLPSAPFIAIPTTAGTGSEVTRNAVLRSSEHSIKVSLRSHHMLPRLALVDPELTYSLPPDVTASTGLDALTQLVEPFVCNASSPLTDAICKEGIPLVARSLWCAYENGSDTNARREMCLASLFGGLALANARLGAVHGFAGAIGGLIPAPHGAVCARLLPLVMTANLRALNERAPSNPAISRYHEVARILTGNPLATAQDGIGWVHELCTALHIQPLSIYGLGKADIPGLVEKSSHASSMKGNPIPLTQHEIQEILIQAL